MTHKANRAAGRPRLPENPREANPPIVFRLLHATADTLIADRTEALRRLADLPGAKLFIVQAKRPITNADTYPVNSAKPAYCGSGRSCHLPDSRYFIVSRLKTTWVQILVGAPASTS